MEAAWLEEEGFWWVGGCVAFEAIVEDARLSE